MNDTINAQSIERLKRNYIIHMILFIIIIIFNFVLLIEIIWLKSLLYKIYFIISFFGIIYFLLPVIPFIYILLEKLSKQLINIFKIASFILCGLVLITGICSICVLMLNDLLSTDFCRECPFNLKNSYINQIYDQFINNNIKEKKLKKECTSRRCIFNYEYLDSEYPHEYICNYNPSDEFEKIKNKVTNESINQIECKKIEDNYNDYNFNVSEIYTFLEMCNSFEEFYICQRINEPMVYTLSEEFKCPKDSYITSLIFFSMISVLLNLMVSFLIWRAEYIKYKDMLKELNNRALSKSLNSTQNISKIKKEEIDKSFKKEPTEIIFVYNEPIINNQQQKSIDENEKKEDNKGNINNVNESNPQIINIIKISNESLKKEDNNIQNTSENANNIMKNKEKEEKEEKKDKNIDTKIKNYISNRKTSLSSERSILEESKNIPEM